MPFAKLRSEKEKPRDVRDKYLKQLHLREIDARKKTQQELLQVWWSESRTATQEPFIYCSPVISFHVAVRLCVSKVDAANHGSHPERAKGAASVSTGNVLSSWHLQVDFLYHLLLLLIRR